MRKNHHTHTPRCGHAVGTEREYIEEAIKGGYDALGFSDHTPWPNLSSPGIRMSEEELPGYIRTVRSLADEYKGRLHISLGLECEYFPDRLDWLREKKLQHGLYLVFGNHFDLSEETGIYFGSSRTKHDIRRYMRTTLQGLNTGLYAFLAHPDLYLRSYPVFDDACKEAAREICRASRHLNIPLEYNLLGLRIQHERGFAGLGYPHSPFWDIAAEENCSVIMNVDAHNPKHLSDTTYYDMGEKTLRDRGLTLVDMMPDGQILPV